MLSSYKTLANCGVRRMDWLPEQIKTSRNLCDVSLLLIETGKRHLLSTVLELLYEQVQVIIEENCVVGDAENKD